MMALLCRPVLIGGLLLLAAARLGAASPTEDRAFEAAAQKFQDEWYSEAESSFGDFAKVFPASPRVAEAIFYQAVARIKLTNYLGALELLSNPPAQTGKWADEYAFWQAEALFEKGDYPAAAAAFGKVLQGFPGSPRRLDAALRESSAWAKLAQWPLVINLLEQSNGVFQTAARANPTNELVPLGQLLLSEAYLAQGECRSAQAALGPFFALKLDRPTQWQGQYLLGRILVADGQWEAALQQVTNLVALADSTPLRSLQAETAAYRGNLFECVGWVDEAIAAYRQNLTGGAPPERQREALLKITQLSLARNEVAEAVDLLGTFLAQYPEAESADLAQLTSGELRLRQFDPGLEPNLLATAPTNSPGATNLFYLQQALLAFQSFTNKFAQSPLVGKAQLDLGWCYWLEDNLLESQDALRTADESRQSRRARVDKLQQCQAAFLTATRRLPPSPDQAMAYFKLADAQFRLAELPEAPSRPAALAGAISNYNAVVENFAGFDEVWTNLAPAALYQKIRAGLASGALALATNALAKLEAAFPENTNTARGLLLTAQELNRTDPAQACGLLTNFIQLAPQSTLLPDLKLAVAATYEQRADWVGAVQQYDQFLALFTNHEATARAEYSRALANFWAGRDTNALAQLTNFIARFHTNELAPLAKWWEADYYYRTGEPAKAEMCYQQIFQDPKWPVSDLTYQALMMAGRAAFEQQLWKNATKYFFQLAQAPSTNLELRAQAYMALADVFISQDSTNKHADLSDAVAALRRAAALCPSNRLAVVALGREADCQLQWPDYDKASNAYQQVFESPLADVALRSMAKVGLGLTLEKLALQKTGAEQATLFKLALHHLLNVFYCDENFLHEGQKRDPFWTQEAGLQAARLAETLSLKTQALHVYQRLQSEFPALRFEERINRLKSQAEPDTLAGQQSP